MAYKDRNKGNTNPYAVGNKVYGGGRPMPTVGPVDRQGYKERDLKHKARREATERRLGAKLRGNYASAAYKRGKK